MRGACGDRGALRLPPHASRGPCHEYVRRDPLVWGAGIELRVESMAGRRVRAIRAVIALGTIKEVVASCWPATTGPQARAAPSPTSAAPPKGTVHGADAGHLGISPRRFGLWYGTILT